MAGVVRENVARSLRPEMIHSRHISAGVHDVIGLQVFEPVAIAPRGRVS